MLPEQSIKCFLLANSELARLDTGVVHTQEGVNVVHRLCTNVGELLDLGSSIFDLEGR